MKTALRFDLTLADTQAPTDEVSVRYTGRLGLANPTADIEPLPARMFPNRMSRYGKGVTAKGGGTKAGGAAPGRYAGKGEIPKGTGAKGDSLPQVRVTVFVPPITGLRTFKAVASDLAGNEQGAGNPTVEILLSLSPARVGPAVFDEYDESNDVVTVRVGDRMY